MRQGIGANENELPMVGIGFHAGLFEIRKEAKLRRSETSVTRFSGFVHDRSVWLHDPDKEVVCFRVIVFLNLVTQIVDSRNVHVGQKRLGDLPGEVGALRFNQLSQMPPESPESCQREC